MRGIKHVHWPWFYSKGWLAPRTMISAFVAGITFAIGHHCFYDHLDGREISDTTYLYSSFTSQQLNLAVGTAFAFMFQACLVLAVSIAFIQAFYYHLLHQKSNRKPTLGRLDGAHGSLTDVFMMLNAKLWWNFPKLLLLVTVARLMPIAAIITPATLSIKSTGVSPPHVSPLRVPGLDFRSMNFLENMPDTEVTYSAYKYSGPSIAVTRTADAILAQGEILPITAPAINTSWSIHCYGPYLKCENMGLDLRRSVESNIHDALKSSRNHWTPRTYNYMAWIPTANSARNHTGNLPFQKGSKKLLEFERGRIKSELKMYIVVVPNILENLYTIERNWANGSTFIQCQIFNSTYDAHFSYIDGIQNITTKVAYESGDHAVPGNEFVFQVVYKGYSNPRALCSPTSKGCFYRPDILQSLSYQAIFDTFTSSILGVLSFTTRADDPPTTLQELDSRVFDTVLQNTPELSKLVSVNKNAFQESLQSQLVHKSDPRWRGLFTRVQATQARLPLKLALEQVFQNFTISLMGSKYLQPSYTSATAPAPAMVTFHRVHDVYSYAMWKLWTAYGVALLWAALAVLTGVVYIQMNRATYSDNFSIIVRIAKGVEISMQIVDGDFDGKDPLPEYLASATIRPLTVVDSAGSKQQILDSTLDAARTHTFGSAQRGQQASRPTQSDEKSNVSPFHGQATGASSTQNAVGSDRWPTASDPDSSNRSNPDATAKPGADLARSSNVGAAPTLSPPEGVSDSQIHVDTSGQGRNGQRVKKWKD